MTVADSSVLVALQTGELARRRLGSERLAAPHLVDSEFMHAVRGLVLGQVVSSPEAERMIQRFGQLAIDRHPADNLRWRIWELRNNLSAYDATYVALAEELDTTLYTRDARIARAAGIRCAVEVL